MSEPTPAEIEAGARALIESLSGVIFSDLGGPPPWDEQDGAEAVLRAVLPDHDARVRRDALQWAAREVRDRLGATAAHRQLSYRDGASDAARLLENLAADLIDHTGDHDARVRADAAQQMLNWLALHGQSSMPGWLLEQAEQEIHVIARQYTGEDTDRDR